jgi:hypothetical protein
MKFTRILRIIHRDLGFFLVGITLVYAISGILLNHLDNKDPAFRKEEKTIQFPANLTEAELTAAWNADKNLPTLKRILRIDENRSRLLLESGIGIYHASDGSLSYEKYKKRVLIYWINRLHYNKVKGWSPVADFYAGALILLAISGLFMMKGKKGIAGAGKWYLIIGILIPVLYGIFFL